jgi:hypothetical protein
MPFSPNRAATPVSISNDDEFDVVDGIGGEQFQYARVINASGTSAFNEGEVYPILAIANAGRRWTQGIYNDQSVRLAFDQDSVLLAGLTTNNGKPDLHFWDARRFEIVEFGDLSSDEAEEALNRF